MRALRLSRWVLPMLAAATLMGMWASSTRADMLFSKSGTDDNSETISASALFHVDSATHNLVVTVTNTTPYTAGWTIDRTDLMTGFFFDITGTLSLGFLSAYLAGGS